MYVLQTSTCANYSHHAILRDLLVVAYPKRISRQSLNNLWLHLIPWAWWSCHLSVHYHMCAGNWIPRWPVSWAFDDKLCPLPWILCHSDGQRWLDFYLFVLRKNKIYYQLLQILYIGIWYPTYCKNFLHINLIPEVNFDPLDISCIRSREVESAQISISNFNWLMTFSR